MKESLLKAQVTLRDYLFIIFHRKKIFLLPALIVFFTAAIGSFFLPKYYASSVLVLVQQEEKNFNPLSTERRAYDVTQTPTLVDQIKTLTEKILNYPQLRLLVSSLGLDKNISSPLELEKLIYSLRERTRVRLRSPEVFQVTYEDRDPLMAQKVVNALVNEFIQYNIERKKKLAFIGVKFASSQAEVYRKKLAKAEKRLYEFQEKFPFQSQGKDTDLNVSLLINYQTSLTTAELNLKQIKSQVTKIKKQLNGEEPVDLTTDVLQSDPIIDSLNTKLKNTQITLDDLRQVNPGSPQIPDLEMQLDDLRSRLLEQTQKAVTSQTPQTSPLLFRQLQQQRDTLELTEREYKKRVTYLSGLVKEYEGRLSTLPEQQRQLASLLRDQKVNSNIYQMLRLKVEENRLDAVELQQKGLRYDILEKGRVPFKPSKPRKLIISIVALFLGILSGLACVFLVEMSDHSFRNIEDARRFSEVPVIGSTMKIMTETEYRTERRKQINLIVILILVFSVFITIAAISSYVQQNAMTQEIINKQMQSNK